MGKYVNCTAALTDLNNYEHIQLDATI